MTSCTPSVEERVSHPGSLPSPSLSPLEVCAISMPQSSFFALFSVPLISRAFPPMALSTCMVGWWGGLRGPNWPFFLPDSFWRHGFQRPRVLLVMRMLSVDVFPLLCTKLAALSLD